jgi:hypothetical protein
MALTDNSFFCLFSILMGSKCDRNLKPGLWETNIGADERKLLRKEKCSNRRAEQDMKNPRAITSATFAVIRK